MILAFTLALSAAPLPQSVTLTATDSKCIASNSGRNWNDNRFRAYWDGPTLGYVDGLAKFDLSSIPDGGTITSMTLRAYHEYGFGNPYNNPEVVAFRSDNDGWSRNQRDGHPGVSQVLTGPMTGFPSNDLAPVDFVLNVGAVNWAQDLADDTLTLGLRNEAGSVGRYSYVYFYGSDSLPAPPELIVNYTTGGPVLYKFGTCPGPMQLAAAGCTPNGAVAIVHGQPGVFIKNGNPCSGLVLGISNPVLAVVLRANGSGTASRSFNAPAGACGRTVQGVDVASCTPTNTLIL